jgi:hypothetical protein
MEEYVPHGPGDLRGGLVPSPENNTQRSRFSFHVSDVRLTDNACHTQAFADILPDTTSVTRRTKEYRK